MIKRIGWSLTALGVLFTGVNAGWIDRTAQSNSEVEALEVPAPMLTVTGVKKLLKGKTFYFVDNYGHCVDGGAVWKIEASWGVVKINKKVTSLTYRSFDSKDRGKIRIRAVRNGVKFFEGNETVTSLLSLHTRKYLYFEDEGYSKLFKNKAAARKYFHVEEKKFGGFTREMLEGKSFYEAGIDNFEALEVNFGKDQVEVRAGGMVERFPYRIDKEGVLTFLDGEGTRIHLRQVKDGYIEVGAYYDGEKFSDWTQWFRKEYGRGVSGFGGDISKLAKYLVKKGLMGHKVTRDGRILGKNFNGDWVIDDDELICSIPQGAELEFYTFRLEGGRLMIREGKNEGIVLRLYTDKNARDTFLQRLIGGDDGIDLEALRGKKVYLNDGLGDTKVIAEMRLQTDGKLTFRFFDSASGRFVTEQAGSYTLDEQRHAIITPGEDGTKEVHRIIDHDAKGFVIREPEGDLSYFYYTRLAALEGMVTIDECDGGSGGQQVSYTLSSGGTVHFVDENGTTRSVPADAWVRLTPKSAYDQGDWGAALNCRIQSDGSFGSECWLDSEEYRDLWDQALQDTGSRYQIVVYKNHIDPEEKHWDCGEDVYRYVGQDLPASDWRDIVVTPDDYQDRSGEQCDG